MIFIFINKKGEKKKHIVDMLLVFTKKLIIFSENIVKMKKFTHPLIKKTIIHTKDGSCYKKRWLYFRQSLFLDIDLTSNFMWKEVQKNENLKFNYNFQVRLKKE